MSKNKCLWIHSMPSFLRAQKKTILINSIFSNHRNHNHPHHRDGHGQHGGRALWAARTSAQPGPVGSVDGRPLLSTLVQVHVQPLQECLWNEKIGIKQSNNQPNFLPPITGMSHWADAFSGVQTPLRCVHPGSVECKEGKKWGGGTFLAVANNAAIHFCCTCLFPLFGMAIWSGCFMPSAWMLRIRTSWHSGSVRNESFFFPICCFSMPCVEFCVLLFQDLMVGLSRLCDENPAASAEWLMRLIGRERGGQITYQVWVRWMDTMHQIRANGTP